MKKLLFLLLSCCLLNCADYFSDESESQDTVQEIIQKDDDVLSTEAEMGDEEFFKMLAELESIDIDNNELDDQNKVYDDSVSMQVEEEL